MHLGRIIPIANQSFSPAARTNSAPRGLETAKGVFYQDKVLFNDGNFEFYVNLIYLFDKAMLEDSYGGLSNEQEKLLKEYFIQAGSITPVPFIKATGGEFPDKITYDYSLLTKMVKQLDEFLAGFMGIEDGNYARFDKQQLYSQRQLFSTEF